MKDFQKQNYYSTTDLSKLFGVSQATIRKRIEAGMFNYTPCPITGRKQFNRSEVDQLLTNNTNRKS